ncbi:MAG TPA: hypothetical protein VMU39_26405 [Solirubrobacteraceae bacterium]|nr:hypothetical protein [Solirubrobacteraceae bacterium]
MLAARPAKTAVKVPVLIAIVASLLLAVPPVSLARAPGADCQPFAKTPCLLPFPNNLFTRPDSSTPTGVRVNLPAPAMPVTAKGVRIDPREWNRSDGFSPGSALLVHVAGFDNARAFAATQPVVLSDMSQAFAKRQPIVVVDEQTGQRQLIWSELDVNAPNPAGTLLMIHPGKNFLDGHTYAVALRFLRNASGRPISAPPWFAKLRDGAPLPTAERSQQTRYARIFKVLGKAGIARQSLVLAWDFTIASRQNLTGRMLAIRNAAFAQLDDTNLADGVVQGKAPSFTVTSTDSLSASIRRVQGTFTVPCYLITCGPSATTGFHYSSLKPDALPTQIPGNVATASFECIIPSTATATTPARISLYGHGLLGSRDEVESGNVQAMATENNFVFCATDWWGFASGDIPGDVAALMNVNLFRTVVDRFQQGVLNMLFLGRLMLHPSGFASDPAFEVGGRPLIDTSHVYYDGNSQGGILGGMTTAVSPDVRRAVLGVSGMNYGGLLLLRSTDFATYAKFLYAAYTDASLHPLILDLMQQLWDRGEPDGYAQQMTTHPLPDTPSHTVLMQIAYGDHQVSDYAAAVEARTIGAFVHVPALDLTTNRIQDKNMFYGIPAIPSYPFGGSAIVIWDSGPGHTQPPPLTDIAPAEISGNPATRDPHEDPRSTVAARTQKSDFLAPNGTVVDVCGGKPCQTDAFTP